jgi:Circularly permutated YpsA SLOG family
VSTVLYDSPLTALHTLPFYLNIVFTKIISGGQTGVDRAALDVAMQLGIPCGGWCPKGRRAEGSPVPKKYPLQETPSPYYPQRTRRNVRDADATLILTEGPPTGGTALTRQLAVQMGKPFLVLDLNEKPDPEAVHDWADREHVHALNIAGPRESENPGIYKRASEFLREILK